MTFLALIPFDFYYIACKINLYIWVTFCRMDIVQKTGNFVYNFEPLL